MGKKHTQANRMLDKEMYREDPDCVYKIKPKGKEYASQGELIDEFHEEICKRIECNQCTGNHDESIWGYGCGMLHYWVLLNDDLLTEATQ